MTKRDKIGVGIFVSLFILFGIILYFTIKPPSGNPGTFDSNVIIDQRVKNLEKSR